MGGEGSGRKQSPETIVKRFSEQNKQTPDVTNAAVLPNLSGVKNEIKSGRYNITTDDLTEGNTNLYSLWSLNGSKIYYNAGNVGIGTASPGDFYSGAENLVVGTGSGDEGLTIYHGSDSNGNIYFARGDAGNDRRAGIIAFNDVDDQFEFGYSSTVNMVIEHSGNVGIGTANPNGKLHVAGDVIVGNGADKLYINEYGADISYITAGDSDRNKEQHLWFQPRNSGGGVFNLLKLDGSGEVYIDGNVGIGTTSPNAKLDINSDKIIIQNSKTPSSASDTGTTGTVCWDADYIYICTAANTWKRTAISSW